MTTSCPQVDVIVLNFNGGRWLGRCLESLGRQIYSPLRITVVDNASTDNSVQLVRDTFPWVCMQINRENVGFSRAYNAAILRSEAPFIALVNPDLHVEPDWLVSLVRVLETDNRLAACTSRIRFAERPDVLNHAGATLTYAGIGWDRGFGCADVMGVGSPQLVGSFSGAAALIRRSAFLEVGGFDEHFFAYCEDTDLSWRLWSAGYRICYVPASVAYHLYGGSGGGRRSSFRLYHTQRNRIASFWKNLGAGRVPAALALSLAFDLYRAGLYLRDRRLDLLGSLLAGTAVATMDLPRVLAQRRAIQQRRVASDAALVRLGVLATPLGAIREYLRLEPPWESPLDAPGAGRSGPDHAPS